MASAVRPSRRAGSQLRGNTTRPRHRRARRRWLRDRAAQSSRERQCVSLEHSARAPPSAPELAARNVANSRTKTITRNTRSHPHRRCALGVGRVALNGEADRVRAAPNGSRNSTLIASRSASADRRSRSSRRLHRRTRPYRWSDSDGSRRTRGLTDDPLRASSRTATSPRAPDLGPALPRRPLDAKQPPTSDSTSRR